MESRWYIPPGKTLENTKIAERSHALHVTKKEWSKITGHLDRNRLLQEAIDKEVEKKRKMKEDSEAMTKNWENSLQNVRKRQDEERQKRQEAQEDTRIKRYYELRKEQDEIRQKYIEQKKKEAYMKEAYPMGLNGALLLAEVIEERKKQKEFDDMLREHERKEEEEYAKKVFADAEQELKEKKEEEEKLLQKKKYDMEFYMSQVREKAAKEERRERQRIEREKVDAINIAKELENLKKFEEEAKIKHVRDVKAELNDFRKKQEEIKRMKKIEEDEIDEIIAIQAEAKHKITCMMKARQAEIRKQEVERREAASKNAVAEAKSRAEEEERILKKAIEEKERAEEEKIRARQEYDAKIRKEREDDRADFIKREEKRLYEENEIKKWEKLNRCKQAEVMKQHDEKLKEKNWEDVLEYRRQLLEQIKEKQEKNNITENELLLFSQYFQAKEDEENEKFFAYAKEVMELAQSKGWTTYPIEQVIKDYKKKHNLMPSVEKNINCEMVKTNCLVNNEPGKRAHNPRSDPNYGACKCRKEKLYR